MDWTQQTADPNEATVRAQVREVLLTKRVVNTNDNVLEFISKQIKGKRVLDIGVCEHAENYIAKSSWRHEAIRAAAGYCLGIDILEALVKKLQNSGYNVACIDATSDLFIGETFDVVFIGDVIEHVNNAVGLLSFAKRHLAEDGRIFVSTPNPFSRKFIKQMQREGTMVVNLDHVAWITPTMAMELGRRAGLNLQRYHLIKKMKGGPVVRAMKALMRRYSAIELAFPDYLYEFSHDPIGDPSHAETEGK